MQPNVALVTSRMTKGECFHHVQVVENMVEVICMSPKTSNNGFVFPLYLYDSVLPDGAVASPVHKRPNIDQRFQCLLSSWYKVDVTPEELFAYIYSILHSSSYRNRYGEYLRRDFPRIPLVKNHDAFLKLAELGQQLIDLHLMRSPELDNPISRFCGKGDSAVAKVTYDADHQRVYINATQYFDNVTPDLWTYQIGGYRVLDKWLKDRKGRFLSAADTQHYSRVIASLARTIAVQVAIDEVLRR